MNYLAFAGAFAVGTLLAYVNYLISSKSLSGKKTNSYSIASFARTFISVLFLVALFLLGQKTGLSETYLLVGGALGLTVPSIFFTMRLLKKSTHKEDDNG